MRPWRRVRTGVGSRNGYARTPGSVAPAACGGGRRGGLGLASVAHGGCDRTRRLRRRTLDGQNARGPAGAPAVAADVDRVPRRPANPGRPAADAAAVRTPHLSRHRGRHARAARGRRRFPSRAPGRRRPDDDRRVAAASCGRSATAHRQRQIATARARVRLCPRAVVTGVAFFDFQHGQTGVAPDGIELHPILGFRCLSGVVVDGSALVGHPLPGTPN